MLRAWCGHSCFISLLIWVAVLPLVAPQCRAAGSENRRSPVILITIDTLRADHLHCYGYSKIETPSVDSLAAEGVRFAHAYAQVPITLPSHAVILTGTYPMFNGVRDFTSAGLPVTIPTLAESFRRAGYRTAAFVSSYALNSLWGLNRGFEVYDDNVGLGSGKQHDMFLLERRGDRTIDKAIEWVSHQTNTPFFLWIHLYDPHSPYHPPEPFLERYRTHPYDGEIAFDDAQIGRFIRELRNLGLFDRTTIALLSDHGESLGEHNEDEHGFFVYTATLHVPLVVKLPGSAARGTVIEQPVGTIDVPSTLSRLAGIPQGDTRSFQGHALLDLRGKFVAAQGQGVYAESYYPHDSFGWHELTALLISRYQFIDAPRQELYDLDRDSKEETNLARANSDIANSLRQTLEAAEHRYSSALAKPAAFQPDPETVERLKSLGYISYQADVSRSTGSAHRADPKDKIGVLNQILRAGDAARAGRFADADLLLSVIEKGEPDLYLIPFQRAENFLAWGKTPDALPLFQRALALNPSFDQTALGLGRTYFVLGRMKEAQDAFELALDRNPNNYLARMALAKVYWRQQSLEKAEAQLRILIRTHSEYAEAHALYGIILAKTQHYPGGIKEIETGLSQGFQDALAYNYLGVCYAETGDANRAEQNYRKAVALDPRYSAAYLNIALMEKKSGRQDEAAKDFQKVCNLSTELCDQYRSSFSDPQP